MTDVTQLRATLAQRLRKAKQAQLEQRLKALGSKAGQLAAPAAEPAAVPRWAPGEGFQSYVKGVMATPAPQERELIGYIGNGKLYRQPDNSLGFTSDTMATSNPQEIADMIVGGNPGAAIRSGSEKTTLGMNLGQARAWARARGVPFAGEYLDELVGWRRGNKARNGMEHVEKLHRKHKPVDAAINSAAVGLPLGVGIAVTSAGLGAGTGILGSAGKVLSGGIVNPTTIAQFALSGTAAGALEGAVSGFGRGADPDTRKDDGSWNVGDRLLNSAAGGAVGGAVGGALGGAIPAVGTGVSSLTRNFSHMFNGGATGRALDVMNINNKPAANVLRRYLGPEAALMRQKLGTLNPEKATLAEAGLRAGLITSESALNDGAANAIIEPAVARRLAEEGSRLTGTLDEILASVPNVPGRDYAMQEIDATRFIADSFRPKLQPLYDEAYATPIDYGSRAGRKVMAAAQKAFRRAGAAGQDALNVANDMIEDDGLSRQILADIADDGSVRFFEEPSTIQLDYLKRALQDVAYANVNAIGKLTPNGQRMNNAARDLRKALGVANPAYDRAVKMGGDSIAVREAVEAGAQLFNGNQAITEAREAAEKSAETLAAYRLGARIAINHKFDELKKTIGDLAAGDDGSEAREMIKAFRSTIPIAKLKDILGKDQAEEIADQVMRTATALKSRVDVNSTTQPRQHIDGIKKEELQGLGFVTDGEATPFKGLKKTAAAWFGAGHRAQQAAEEAMNEDIAKVMTARGPQSQAMLDAIERFYKDSKAGQQAFDLSGKFGRPVAMGLAPITDPQNADEVVLTITGQKPTAAQRAEIQAAEAARKKKLGILGLIEEGGR